MESAKSLIKSIDESAADALNEESTTKLITQFNDLNENTFQFKGSQSDSENGDVVFTRLSQLVHGYLTSSWTSVVRAVNTNAENAPLGAEFTSHTSLVISCLNAIRLLSRDKSIIHVFESEPLLTLIQKIASLFILTETNSENSSVINSNCLTNASTSGSVSLSNNNELDLVTLSALKSLSNLIYHSKFIQEFYIRNGVAETITIYLKQFNPVDSFSNQTLKLTKINVMLFNMRILFLLTALNKELRMKLREKLQVITYLIEIIDQIMKERLNDDTVATNPVDVVTGSVDSSSDQATTQDFCYLKSIDIDFINEILKILYNLTIDITSPGSTSAAFSIRMANNEEDEAHLMHLVSVLRDLVTCRLEEEFDPVKSTNKLKMLHSNIVNLLTNMPNLCYEELMTPSIGGQSSGGGSPAVSSPANKLFKQISNYSFRLAHNRKRLSRRSKRIKKKQQDDGLSPIVESNSLMAPQQQANAEYNSLFLINNDEDLEFEGKNVEALIIILEYLNYHITSYIKAPSDQTTDPLYPILLLFSLMTKSNRTIRHYYKHKVLPPLKKNDLLSLPESGLQLRNKLVKLMTDSNMQIKRLSAQFLFILCKESVSRLVKYSGFGNAAGLLADAGLMLATGGGSSSSSSNGGSYSSDSEDSDSEDYKKLEPCINQVTGRAEVAGFDEKANRYVRPKHDIFEGMSEEQKEYEAVRLVQAIDKLARSGGPIKPASIGPDGRPVEIEHVLQLQESGVKSGLLTNKTIGELKDQNGNKSDDDD